MAAAVSWSSEATSLEQLMTEQNQGSTWGRGGASGLSLELPTFGCPSKVCNRLLIVRCFLSVFSYFRASQVVLVVKNLPANAGDGRGVGAIPGSRRSPGGEHGIHSNILAWRIPRTEEPGGTQSRGWQRVKSSLAHWHRVISSQRQSDRHTLP